MANAPGLPQLTPQFCFHQTALRGKPAAGAGCVSRPLMTNASSADFLRISRATVDDCIVQSLNALAAPNQDGADPASAAARSRLAALAHGPIDARACAAFQHRVLFPSWETRARVLSYCAAVATAPDPDDPGTVARQAESDKASQRVVDERLDPYSGRYFPREARADALGNLIRNERAVEAIVRARSWALLGERCGHHAPSAEEALQKWRRAGD